ncbi:hypothetical protein [Oceanotoga phage vB_OteS-UFV02]
MKTKKIIEIINNILSKHERYRNSYFWSSAGTNAWQRRKEEFDDKYEFFYQGKKYQVFQKLDISCKNYYYHLHIYEDDKKKDIRSLKKILKREGVEI